jgi:8-oxo-dGTP diphosphatase
MPINEIKQTLDIRHAVWCVLENEKNEFLLLKRSKYSNNGGKWNFPGGRVDDNENIINAGKREMHEETGVTIANWKLFLNVHIPNKIYHYIRPTKFVQPKIFLNHESSKYDWFSIDRIHDLNLHNSTMQFFRHINNKRLLEFRKTLVNGGLFLNVIGILDDEVVAKALICIPSRKLHNVHISPQYRGKGYSHDLMAHLMTLDCAPLTLTAYPNQDGTLDTAQLVHFYSNYGFIPENTMANASLLGPVPMRRIR